MRKEINPANNVPLSEKNIGINLFDGMSKDRKIEVLKKRSHEHFQSKLKERKDELLNKATEENFFSGLGEVMDSIVGFFKGLFQ